ncbi:response regulator transcription factor [Vallitalea okinawensis]|uniref:response regulator transcription factor n=1 Tax=Vallitalea okinawensis TaxID=2078660 RepID=UPI000CFBCCC3|nr:response regulator transcription factor [Vallitalea okinawensis]
MERVLIIEDEKQIARFIELELKYEGYDVDIAYDGRNGLDKFHHANYDLILLDIMLPGVNGMEVCRRIRKESDIPIIMVSAKDEIMDRVQGLEMGAHDYLTKPFAIEELLARIRRLLKWCDNKHNKSEESNELSAKELKLNWQTYEVLLDDSKIDLTNKEFELLKLLLENKNIVLGRDKILNEVWGYDYFGETNVVDVYIRYLRSKIDDVAEDKYIHTVRGVGYVIKE